MSEESRALRAKRVIDRILVGNRFPPDEFYPIVERLETSPQLRNVDFVVDGRIGVKGDYIGSRRLHPSDWESRIREFFDELGQSVEVNFLSVGISSLSEYGIYKAILIDPGNYFPLWFYVD